MYDLVPSTGRSSHLRVAGGEFGHLCTIPVTVAPGIYPAQDPLAQAPFDERF